MVSVLGNRLRLEFLPPFLSLPSHSKEFLCRDFRKCLKAMLNKAVEWGMIDKYPVSMIKLFRTENRRLRFLEMEKIERLVSVCEGNLAAIITVALHTGMRRGEILSLKWRDVDFTYRLIILLRTKSGEKREIPMNNIILI